MVSKYIIYNYYLQRYNGGCDDRVSAEECVEKVESLMPDDIKKNGLEIVSTKTKGGVQELSHHGNLLEQHFRNMACLLIEANKTKKITQDYVDHEEEHNPFIHVLFDFNPEHCLIAIERKESVMKVEQAVELITLTFDRLLRDYGWQFKCEQPMIPMDFWKILNDIRERFDDRLKKVSLVFDNDKSQKSKKDKSEEEKKLRFVDELISHFGKGGLYIDCADDKKMEEYKDDIIYFATLCAQNNYQLVAEFSKFGTLCYTDIFPAIMPLGNDVLGEFLNRKAETGMREYKLETWFKNIHKLFNQQEEASEDERRRGEIDKI